MITVAGQPINITKFPDGTSQVWKLSPEQLACTEVVWKYEGDHEIFLLAQLGSLLREHDNYVNSLTLKVDFLPYSRQDKKISNESTFGLHNLLKILAHNYSIINTFDVHNPKVVNNYINLNNTLPKEQIEKIIKDEGIDVLVFPDEGAAKRYSQLSDKPSIFAHKTRDQSTGMITGSGFSDLDPKMIIGKNILVVDDICDGGATFVSLASLLKMDQIGWLNLYVSHGIFSKGTRVLYSAGYCKIFTKDGLVE